MEGFCYVVPICVLRKDCAEADFKFWIERGDWPPVLLAMLFEEFFVEREEFVFHLNVRV